MLFQLSHHRRGIFHLRKRRFQRRQHDQLNLIGGCLRRVERRRRVADEEYLIVPHIGFPRRRFAAHIRANAGDDDGIDAAIAQDEIEVGAVESTVAGLLEDNIVPADDNIGMSSACLLPLLIKPAAIAGMITPMTPVLLPSGRTRCSV